MDRKTPMVADLVRRAVEVCDPEDRDQTLGRFEERFEDDDEPITAVEHPHERLSLALDGADFDVADPAVSVASAVVLYLAAKRGKADYDRSPSELMRLAARARWHQHPPSDVATWLTAHGVGR